MIKTKISSGTVEDIILEITNKYKRILKLLNKSLLEGVPLGLNSKGIPSCLIWDEVNTKIQYKKVGCYKQKFIKNNVFLDIRKIRTNINKIHAKSRRWETIYTKPSMCDLEYLPIHKLMTIDYILDNILKNIKIDQAGKVNK